MSRFLFVVPPFAGHILPTVAVGDHLRDRGHTVAWAGHPTTLDLLLPSAAQIVPIPAEFGDQTLTQMRSRSLGLRGVAAFRFLWEELLIPLAVSMVPGVITAVDDFHPDVLIVDQQAPAGALVARQRGLPWATSATTSGELTNHFSTMPKLGTWARQCLIDFQHRFAENDPIDLRFSDHLVLAFTTTALLGANSEFPSHYKFVGPSIGTRARVPDFTWNWLDSAREHVLISLGTLNQDAGQRFFATAVTALSPLANRLQAIIIAPPQLVGPVPPHIVARESIPQLDLLPHLQAVICHGGHNTVCETLAHGLPLVIAPIRDDQPIVANQVIQAGAGIRVRFGRVSAGELRNAITAVLDDRAYQAAAQRIQSSFIAAGGAAAAADHLEKLL
jgi:MGT family glycosyltransferase